MLNKNLMVALMVVMVSILNGYSKNILSIYDSHKKVYSSKSINPHYVGPIFCTGGAMSDINRYIKDMAPENIGSFSSNSLTINETAPLKNQVYTFKKVEAYAVTKDGSSFTIMHMKSKIGKDKFDILVDVKGGPNFDRTITIYKNNVATALILWVDNSKIIQKKTVSSI